MNTSVDIPFAKVPSEKKLSLGTKLSYGIGDFASNMSWALVSSFLLFFYTDVYGLTPAVIAVMMLVIRVWDAINDPIMGLIMERTKSKYGRFRPYLLYTPVLMAISNVAMFTVPSFGPFGMIVYAYITYFCLEATYTAVNVPYGALATVMTQEHDERTSLNSFRMFASGGASIVIGSITMPLIQKFGGGNMKNGFFIMALIYSAISVPLFWLVFKNCKEVITPSEEQKLTLKASFQSVVKNMPLILVYLLGFFTLSAIFGRMGILLYYCKYNLNNTNLFALFMLVFGLSNLAGIMAAPAVAKKLGKKMSAIVSCLVGATGLLIIYFAGYSNILMITTGTIIFGLMGFGLPLLFSMTADCVEYAELKTGVRAEGFIYAGTSLSTKFASAFAASFGIFFIGYFGYVPNAVQSSRSLQSINIACNLIPAVMLVLAIVPMLFYIIDKEYYNKMILEINERKQKEAK
jgi:glycoside/pentoside/hexuronide:cation symporter, GPH family